MFNVFKWLDEVKKRRKEMEGKETFRECYLRKLNNQDEAVIAEVREKIAAERKKYAENPNLREMPTCMVIGRDDRAEEM